MHPTDSAPKRTAQPEKHAFPGTPPARRLVLSNEPNWGAALAAAGFRMQGDDILPPCRVTEYPGVCVLFEQWEQP